MKKLILLIIFLLIPVVFAQELQVIKETNSTVKLGDNLNVKIILNNPYNLSAGFEIKEVLPQGVTPFGAKQGINDFGKIGYGGPCPPSGTHRYFFKLYALDIKLSLESGATKKQLLSAMKEHILTQAEIIGKYKR